MQGTEDLSPDEHANNMVRLSECAKASLYPPQGEILNNFNNLNRENKEKGSKNVSIIDQAYIMVSGQVEQGLQDKIISGQYVDFSKLLPRDRVLLLDDSKMEDQSAIKT